MAVKRPTRHPLLTEVINTLPARDAGFPAQERQAWLDMMVKAFDVVYGKSGAAVPRVEIGAKPSTSPSSSPTAGYLFYVDKDGFARGPNGRQIIPQEVPKHETLWDLRELDAGDIETVRWQNGWDPKAPEMGIDLRVVHERAA